MLLAEKGLIPPKYFEHDPNIKNINGETVAILLADYGIIPPKEWCHDPNITYEVNNI